MLENRGLGVDLFAGFEAFNVRVEPAVPGLTPVTCKDICCCALSRLVLCETPIARNELHLKMNYLPKDGLRWIEKTQRLLLSLDSSDSFDSSDSSDLSFNSSRTPTNSTCSRRSGLHLEALRGAGSPPDPSSRDVSHRYTSHQEAFHQEASCQEASCQETSCQETSCQKIFHRDERLVGSWLEHAFEPLRQLMGTDHIFYVGPELDGPSLMPRPLPMPVNKSSSGVASDEPTPVGLENGSEGLGHDDRKRGSATADTLKKDAPRDDRLLVLSPAGGEAFARGIAGQFAGYQGGFLQFTDPYATYLHGAARSLGVSAIHDGFVHDPDDPRLRESFIYQEIYRPVGIERKMALSVPLSKGAAMLLCGYSEADLPAAGGPLHEALRLLLPAFEAGLHFRQRLSAVQAQWSALLDMLPGPLAVFSAEGEELYRNCALRRLLASEPDEEVLARAVLAFGREMSIMLIPRPSSSCKLSGSPNSSLGGSHQPLESISRTVKLKGGRYQMRASTDQKALSEPAVIVSVERVEAIPPREVFEERFGLTPREAEVAQLIAQGYTDKDVAERLFVSLHTARRHAERVLRKMRLNSRAGVLYACLSTGAWR